jgi:hypothetical protein
MGEQHPRDKAKDAQNRLVVLNRAALSVIDNGRREPRQDIFASREIGMRREILARGPRQPLALFTENTSSFATSSGIRVKEAATRL